MAEKRGLSGIFYDRILPIGTVVAVIIAAWYGFAVLLNAQFERDQAARAGTEISTGQLVRNTMAQERPVLPAPHQVASEIWKTTAQKKMRADWASVVRWPSSSRTAEVRGVEKTKTTRKKSQR